MLDVAVVGVPDSRLGEVVACVPSFCPIIPLCLPTEPTPFNNNRARVTTKPNFDSLVTESSIIDLVARQLPKHCIPVLVVVSTDTLPRNAVGKAVKTELREELGRIWEQRGRVPAVVGVSEGKAKAKL